MGLNRKANEEFVQAVRDHLNGTPNAHHPVQFHRFNETDYACTLCGAMVRARSDEYWFNLHRRNHDEHNRVHQKIEDKADSYVMPPTYGGI